MDGKHPRSLTTDATRSGLYHPVYKDRQLLPSCRQSPLTLTRAQSILSDTDSKTSPTPTSRPRVLSCLYYHDYPNPYHPIQFLTLPHRPLQKGHSTLPQASSFLVRHQDLPSGRVQPKHAYTNSSDTGLCRAVSAATTLRSFNVAVPPASSGSSLSALQAAPKT